MCGIAGVCLRGSPDSVEPAIQAMLAAMAHRGPDDQGLALVTPRDHVLGLGSRRLAIQDLSPAGHQPMHDAATGNWVVFNGEIYNFRALRSELATRGARFESGSDTEVLLKAYARWGVDALHRLRGMFAFALWDAGQRTLLLARDRLGEKPLYYFQDHDRFLFASEVRGLLASGLVPRRLSLPALNSFLALGAIQDPLAIIDDVESLPPGHYGIWQDGRFSTSAYWSLPAGPSEELATWSRSAIVEQVRQLLLEAVELQLISDVPLGAFLSGGIDSSAIAALMKRISGIPPSTVSIVFPERAFSEANYMRAVAHQLGTKHTEVVLSSTDFLAELPHALKAMDQPTFDGVNTFVVSKHTRAAGLTVALSGLGGDELFAGYHTFATVSRLESVRQWLPGPTRPVVGALVQQALRDSDRGRKLRRWFAERDLDGGAYLLIRELFGPPDRQRLASALPDRSVTPESGWPDLVGLDPVNAVSRWELTHYLPNVLLRDTDGMSMAHSLEVRVPFLDYKLVEFVTSLPGSFKRHRSMPKALLVEALRGDLPPEVVQRRKMGFTLPFALWLRGPLRTTVESTLLDPRRGGQLADVLSSAAVEETWKRFLSGRASWVRPWALYVLKEWGERYLI